jgi:threonylcarbamoyladenosine tRNA methylthiotransferase MtaB
MESEISKAKNEKIITLGCRLNDAESEMISGHLKDLKRDDLIVVNTCAVTESAKKESIQKISELIKKNQSLPSDLQKKIYVTGCAVQLDPDRFLEIPGVDRVIGNMDKLSKTSYEEQSDQSDSRKIWRKMFGEKEKIKATDDFFKENPDLLEEKRERNKKIERQMGEQNFIIPKITKLEGKTRGLIQIQNGCNHDCTFCVIYIARGKNRSVAPSEILSQVKILLLNGYKEIVLTGVDITDYGEDLGTGMNLAKLLKKILNAFGSRLERLRLSSIDVAEIDPELFKVLSSSSKIMPYFHLSLQSGSDLILKRMKRRHSRAQIQDFCQKMLVARPESVFGADIIAGFPTETDELFGETLNLLQEIPRFIHLHIFSFSSHSQTPSSKMPQVSGAKISERAKILRKIGLENRFKFYSEVLKLEPIQNVLFESEFSGYSDQFLKFNLANQGFEKIKGQIRKVRLLEVTKDEKKTLQPFSFLGEIMNQ